MNSRELSSKMRKLGNFVKKNLDNLDSALKYTQELFPAMLEYGYEAEENQISFLLGETFKGDITKKHIKDTLGDTSEKDRVKAVGIILRNTVQIYVNIYETYIEVYADILGSYVDKYHGGLIDMTIIFKSIKIDR